MNTERRNVEVTAFDRGSRHGVATADYTRDCYFCEGGKRGCDECRDTGRTRDILTGRAAVEMAIEHGLTTLHDEVAAIGLVAESVWLQQSAAPNAAAPAINVLRYIEAYLDARGETDHAVLDVKALLLEALWRQRAA